MSSGAIGCLHHCARAGNLKEMSSFKPILALVFSVVALLPPAAFPKEEMLPDMTGSYEFLSEDNTLAVLEEEERLSGYIDILEGGDEDGIILTYTLNGTRKVNQVEFKTKTIHRIYYRFSGKLLRGEGKTENDPDFLRVAGTLETVTVNGETGEESVERTAVVLRSLGREKPGEEDED